MPSFFDEKFERKLWDIVNEGKPKIITHNNKRYYISRKIIDNIRQTNKRRRYISINSNFSRYSCRWKCHW